MQSGPMGALERALGEAREARDLSRAESERDAFLAIERVREIADHLRSSIQRVTDLEAGLQASRRAGLNGAQSGSPVSGPGQCPGAQTLSKRAG
jgi:hypothetical protein